MAGHHGNWELLAGYIAARGVPVDVIVRGMANPLFDSYINEIRSALVSVIDQLGGYTHVGPGPWVVIAGGVLAIVGGILTFRWATRVMMNPEPLPPH